MGEGTRRLGRFEIVVLAILFVIGVREIVARPVPSPLPTRHVIDLGDHVSHVGSTLIFLDKGLRVLRETQRALADRPVSLAEARAAYERIRFQGFAPEDYLALRSIPDRAFHVNWPDIVKPYPLGLYVYTLPEAMLFRRGVGEHTIATFSLLKFLLASLLLAALLAPWYSASDRRRTTRRLPWTCVSLSAFVWALHGIYDSIAIAALVAAIGLARAERYLMAWLLGSLALFLHYRMILYAPFLAWVA
jgi:hypothetical protein